MTVRLVHHRIESVAGSVSPFDEYIVQIVAGQEARIVCPYLGLDYLRRIVELSKSWRLLTDVEEWLSTQNTAAHAATRDFIVDNPDRIRHVRDLHAKVVIGGDRAMVGSANLTLKGITGRPEMATLFEQEPQVEELENWFDDLWSQSTPIDATELETLLQTTYDMSPAYETKVRSVLTSGSPVIRASLKPIKEHRKQISTAEATDQQLIERFEGAPSRHWVETYLDLAKLLIETTDLREDDPRLVTSMPKRKWFLPITINNRYVLACRKDFVSIVIYGPEFEIMPDLQAKVAGYGYFNPLPGENVTDPPFLLYFEDINFVLSSSNIVEGWLQAASNEVQRAKSSPYRKFHQPAVYKSIVDLDYRTSLLDEAFREHE